MPILINQLSAQRGLLDGVQLWRNTLNKGDLELINALDGRDNFFKVMPLDDIEGYRDPLQTNTGRFYMNCTDEDTIYIRFDDDIVYIHEDAIRNLVDYRIDHPEAFLVYPVIWNNAVASALLQENGKLDKRHGKVERFCMDPVGWGSPEFAKYVHEVLLDKIDEGETEDLYIPHTVLETKPIRGRMEPLRMSVSCICWFGKDFGNVAPNQESLASQLWYVEEEMWLTEQFTKRLNKMSHMCGDSIICHFSFFKQRASLDNTDFLERYKDISQRMLHDAYYRLIDLDNNPPEPYNPGPWWMRVNPFKWKIPPTDPINPMKMDNPPIVKNTPENRRLVKG
jgi:hypothetical protein